jgi:hypothetical protein
MDRLYTLLTTVFEAGVAEGLRNIGMHSGEITQREAFRVYGTWFREAVQNGRIKPCRYNGSKNCTKWYKVRDILALKGKDELAAYLLETR